MPIATLRSSWASVRSKGSSRSMVRPFEKPHGRLPRRPSVPSPSRNHHDRLDRPLVPSIRLRTGSELVKGCAPFPALRRFKRSKFKSSRTDSGGELPRFENSRNVEMNQVTSLRQEQFAMVGPVARKLAGVAAFRQRALARARRCGNERVPFFSP